MTHFSKEHFQTVCKHPKSSLYIKEKDVQWWEKLLHRVLASECGQLRNY
jgi:hypothetical protein